jgi:SNF2 family DNA or RNA helicase
MRKTFLKHQDEAMAYARKRKAIGLFLAMRLGKTPVAIRWARKHRLRKILVVAPLSVLPGMQWDDEIRQETGRTPIIWPDWKKQTWLIHAENIPGWYGINYEAIRNNPDILDFDWDGIILDESTRIRNPKAQITKILLNATDHIRYRAILSGLPNPESPLDLFCQMKFLHGEFLGYNNYWAFRQSKFNQVGYMWFPRKGVTEQIKQAIHTKCFIRSQRQVGMGNKKVFERRYVYMTSVQKRLQREIEREFTAGKEHSTKWAPVQQTWLARLAGGFGPGLEMLTDNKLRLLKQIVTEEKSKDQIVVWFRFTAEIKAAYTMLRNAGVSCKIIRGKTDKRKRPIIQRKFHAGTYRVLLMQVKVGQYGLNLACANIAIYYSNAWDHEIRSQSQQRIEHMMKKVPLLYIDLVTKDSIDEAVLDTLQEKKRDSRRFLREVMTNFTAGLRRAA